MGRLRAAHSRLANLPQRSATCTRRRRLFGLAAFRFRNIRDPSPPPPRSSPLGAAGKEAGLLSLICIPAAPSPVIPRLVSPYG
jgi:hypothetical protein